MWCRLSCGQPNGSRSAAALPLTNAAPVACTGASATAQPAKALVHVLARTRACGCMRGGVGGGGGGGGGAGGAGWPGTGIGPWWGHAHLCSRVPMNSLPCTTRCSQGALVQLPAGARWLNARALGQRHLAPTQRQTRGGWLNRHWPPAAAAKQATALCTRHLRFRHCHEQLVAVGRLHCCLDGVAGRRAGHLLCLGPPLRCPGGPCSPLLLVFAQFHLHPDVVNKSIYIISGRSTMVEGAGGTCIEGFRRRAAALGAARRSVVPCWACWSAGPRRASGAPPAACTCMISSLGTPPAPLLRLALSPRVGSHASPPQPPAVREDRAQVRRAQDGGPDRARADGGPEDRG